MVFFLLFELKTSELFVFYLVQHCQEKHGKRAKGISCMPPCTQILIPFLKRLQCDIFVGINEAFVKRIFLSLHISSWLVAFQTHFEYCNNFGCCAGQTNRGIKIFRRIRSIMNQFRIFSNIFAKDSEIFQLLCKPNKVASVL